MKKIKKLLFGTISLAAATAGVYYFYKKFVKSDSQEDLEDFHDFEDEYDDYEFEDEVQQDQEE